MHTDTWGKNNKILSHALQTSILCLLSNISIYLLQWTTALRLHVLMYSSLSA